MLTSHLWFLAPNNFNTLLKKLFFVLLFLQSILFSIFKLSVAWNSCMINYCKMKFEAKHSNRTIFKCFNHRGVSYMYNSNCVFQYFRSVFLRWSTNDQQAEPYLYWTKYSTMFIIGQWQFSGKHYVCYSVLLKQTKVKE